VKLEFQLVRGRENLHAITKIERSREDDFLVQVTRKQGDRTKKEGTRQETLLPI